MNDTPETDAVEANTESGNIVEAFYFMRSHAWNLERERDEAREYADKLAEGLPEGMLPKDVDVLRDANLKLATELATVTEQRDRLAMALRMITTFDYSDLQCDNGHGARSVATEALQSIEALLKS